MPRLNDCAKVQAIGDDSVVDGGSLAADGSPVEHVDKNGV